LEYRVQKVVNGNKTNLYTICAVCYVKDERILRTDEKINLKDSIYLGEESDDQKRMIRNWYIEFDRKIKL
jgi:hypothetical protein